MYHHIIIIPKVIGGWHLHGHKVWILCFYATKALGVQKQHFGCHIAFCPPSAGTKWVGQVVTWNHRRVSTCPALYLHNGRGLWFLLLLLVCAKVSGTITKTKYLQIQQTSNFNFYLCLRGVFIALRRYDRNAGMLVRLRDSVSKNASEHWTGWHSEGSSGSAVRKILWLSSLLTLFTVFNPFWTEFNTVTTYPTQCNNLPCMWGELKNLTLLYILHNTSFMKWHTAMNVVLMH